MIHLNSSLKLVAYALELKLELCGYFSDKLKRSYTSPQGIRVVFLFVGCCSKVWADSLVVLCNLSNNATNKLTRNYIDEIVRYPNGTSLYFATPLTLNAPDGSGGSRLGMRSFKRLNV